MTFLSLDLMQVFYHAAAIAAIVGVSLFPVFLGRLTGCGSYEMARIIAGSTILGWTVFGWFYALYLSTNLKFK
ncbi:MAG: hypothetical protein FWD33_02105 [Alphaproteobacteria bacterium]|nr:hypothetical protein [Alphaproteobacteria bacterium]